MAKKIALTLVCLLLTFGSVQAAWNDWNDSSGDGLWRTAANWSLGLPDPLSSDPSASVGHWNGDIEDLCTIDSGTAAEAKILSVGNGSANVASTSHGTGRVHMTGGTLAIETLWLGVNPYDQGEFTLNDGTVTMDSMQIGRLGRGTAKIHGGSVTVNTLFQLPQDAGNTNLCTLTIDGGTLTYEGDDYFMIRGGGHYLNIAGGTLKVKSSVNNTLAVFQNYESLDLIRPYNNESGATLNIVEQGGYIEITATRGVVVISGWMKWDGEAGDELWDTGLNWNNNGTAYPDNTVPTAANNVGVGFFNGSTLETVYIPTGTDAACHLLSIGHSQGGTGKGKVVVDGGTLTVDSALRMGTTNTGGAQGLLQVISGDVVCDTLQAAYDDRGTLTISGGSITCNVFDTAREATASSNSRIYGGELIIEGGNFLIKDNCTMDITDGVVKIKDVNGYDLAYFQDFVNAGKLTAFDNAIGATITLQDQGDYLVLGADSPELVPHWVPWDDEGADNLWTTAANWSDNVGNNDWPEDTVPNAGCNAAVGYWINGATHTAQITAGMDIMLQGFAIGSGANGNESHGVIDMSGGSILCKYIAMAQNGTTAQAVKRDKVTGTFNLTGGDVTVTDYVAVSRDGLGALTVDGGATLTTNALYLALNETGLGTIDLLDGMLMVEPHDTRNDNFSMDNNSSINVEAGTLKYNLGGNRTLQDFLDWAAEGRIRAYNNDPRATLTVETVGDYVVVSADIDLTLAVNPTPADGGRVTDLSLTLMWDAGQDAVAHNVYFSTVREDVENALDPTDPTNIADGIATTSVPVSGLQLGQTYYWRVDEVDAGDNVSIGMIWEFTIVSYVTIESFETYVDYRDMLDAGWSEHDGAWLDLATDVASGGSKSMFIDCYQLSSVKKTFDQPQDWVNGVNGTSLLQVYMKGDPFNNGLTAVTMTLTDSNGQDATLSYSPISDMISNDDYDDLWVRWLMPLADFDTANPSFDRTSVASLTFEVDISSGYVWIDSLALLLSLCTADYLPAGDMNNDCAIGMEDFVAFSEEFNMPAPTMPVGAPVVWYKFDETSGSVATDSSGNGQDATAKFGGAAASAEWSAFGADGGCIEFDGDYCMRVPDGALAAVQDEVTVTCWINGHPDVQPAAGTTFAAKNTEGDSKQLNAHTPWSSGYVYFDTGGEGAAYDRVSWLAPTNSYTNGWNLYVFTKDAVAGVQRIYCNGALVAEATGLTRPIDVEVMTIGANADETGSPYVGRIDDFRVYNYAFTASEVLAFSGVNPRADFDNSGVVDFVDMQMLASNWLQEILWP